MESPCSTKNRISSDPRGPCKEWTILNGKRLAISGSDSVTPDTFSAAHSWRLKKKADHASSFPVILEISIRRFCARPPNRSRQMSHLSNPPTGIGSMKILASGIRCSKMPSHKPHAIEASFLFRHSPLSAHRPCSTTCITGWKRGVFQKFPCISTVRSPFACPTS